MSNQNLFPNDEVRQVGFSLLSEYQNGLFPEIEKILQDNIALGSSIGINGTPAFVLGEELIPGAMELASFKEKINSLRTK